MMNAIIENGWTNEKFVVERTEGYEVLAESVKAYTPEAVEAITGVKAADMVEAARLFATSGSAVDTLLHGHNPAYDGHQQRPRPGQPLHDYRADRQAFVGR